MRVKPLSSGIASKKDLYQTFGVNQVEIRLWKLNITTEQLRKEEREKWERQQLSKETGTESQNRSS